MNKDWDAPWKSGAGMSKPGIGERAIEWPTFGGQEFGGTNPTCATCGGRARGKKRCDCEEPDWRVCGKSLEDDKGTQTALEQKQLFQAWCVLWLKGCYRVLRPGGVIKVFGACYDSQTEVLTRRGWVPFPKVRDDDWFASLREDHRVEWLQPTELVCQPHYEDMIQYRTNRVDLLVTNNHKVFVAPAVPTSSAFRLERADSHADSVRMIKTSKGRVDQNHATDFVIPASSQSIGPGGMRELPEIRIPWDRWLPFFGLWLAEGSATFSGKTSNRSGNGYAVKLCHFTIPNLEMIRDQLEPWFNVNIYPDIGTAIINSKQLCTYLQQFGKAWEKFVPIEVKALPVASLRLLIDWYSRGDGDDRHRLYTSSPRLRDDWQEIAMYAGWAADWVERTHPKKPPTIRGREIHQRRPQYRVSLLKTQIRPLIKKTKKGRSARTVIPASKWGGEAVYCVELPRNHTLYVRRNGKAVWCGNTRMFHRTAAAMEEAGFVLHPEQSLEAWNYGSGFPKYLNTSKAIDQHHGKERPVVGTTMGKGGENLNLKARPGKGDSHDAQSCGAFGVGARQIEIEIPVTEAATADAARFDGWATALKPAWEPFVCGTKPAGE